MANGWEFFWAVVASTAGTSTLLALAIWLFKTQIAHWLNKDIEGIKSQHQRELEANKATYQRELEAYRTSLIAQAEAVKANQDVRKVIAVRVAQRQCYAVERLHAAYWGFGLELESLLMGWDSLSQGERTATTLRLDAQLKEAREATRESALYVHHTGLTVLVDFNNDATAAVSKMTAMPHMTSKELGLSANEARVVRLRPWVEAVAARNLRAMREMQDSPVIEVLDPDAGR